MRVAVIIFLFLKGISIARCITVSPDLGLRNATGPLSQIKLNRTLENDENLYDRYRRLIPYMTFYIPNEFPISQHYNYVPVQQQQQQQHQIQQQPPQQKQIIAVYQPQSHHQPPTGPQLEPQQVQNLRPAIYIQPRYPNQRPQYQAIMYNTRHQTPNQGSNRPQMERLPAPVSFKESHVKMPYRQHHPHHQYSTSKFNLTPFLPENKIPGHFTPIVYMENVNSINYNAKPQIGAVKQYTEAEVELDDRPHTHPQIQNQQQQQHPVQQQHQLQQNQQQLQRPGLSLPNLESSSPVLASTVSPSPRPIYAVYNDIPLQQEQQEPQYISAELHQEPHQILPEPQKHLTPEQKYVAYLQQRLKHQHDHSQQHHQQEHSHQQHHQQQQQQPQHQTHHYVQILKPSPSPVPEQQYVYIDKQPEPPVNQIIYQTSDGEQERQPLLSNNDKNNHNFAEYQEPNQQQLIAKNPERFSVKNKYSYKPIVYVTTARPLLKSVTPTYTKHVSSSKPSLQQETIQEEIEYQRDPPKPVYIPSPASTSGSVRQHLTETTQVPPPVLTTYHPNYATQKSKYSSHYSASPPPAQKFKPTPRYKSTVLVAKPVAAHKPVAAQKPVTLEVIRPEVLEDRDPNPLPDIASSSLAEILRKLQESNHLPHTLTPDNIDNSIKTLVRILNNLKQSQTIVDDPPQHHEDDEYEYHDDSRPVRPDTIDHHPQTPGPTSGRPGVDYPTLTDIPPTSFNCKEQRYKGFFGDPETNCQVWHYCDLNGGQASFLCPNGTIFSQVALTCDWWFNVKCSSTAQLYVLNERLYKYILPFTPKFPEDYSGPLVDKYLALKFKEMEEKMRKQKQKGKNKSEDEDGESTDTMSNSEQDQSPAEEDVSDEEDDHSSIDTGLPYIPASSPSSTSTSTEETIPVHAIIVATTSTPRPSPSPTPTKTKISVESEKVEVIEIKPDGISGHLIPGHRFEN